MIEEALERLDFDVVGGAGRERGLLERREAARTISYRMESAYHADGDRRFSAEVNAREPTAFDPVDSEGAIRAARGWADTWRRSWEALDLEAIVALYADDAILSTEPFRDPHRGRAGVRDYVRRVFAEEEDPHVETSEPIVSGGRASVSWWASLLEEGAATTLAGTSVLRFDADGLVVEQWDAWNSASGRRDPPSGFGPFERGAGS